MKSYRPFEAPCKEIRTLKMEAQSAETSVSIYLSTRRNIPEDWNHQKYPCDNLKSRISRDGIVWSSFHIKDTQSQNHNTTKEIHHEISLKNTIWRRLISNIFKDSVCALQLTQFVRHKNHSVNITYGKNHCLLWDPFKTPCMQKCKC